MRHVSIVKAFSDRDVDPDKEYRYRYEDKRRAAPVNEFEQPIGEGSLEIVLYRWEAIKHTPKGVWLELWGHKRFVLNKSHRRFACSTIDEARASFVARKNRQASIYEARAMTARQAIAVFKPAPLFGLCA